MLVADGLAGAVGTGGESARAIVGVGKRPSVEVGLGGEAPGRVVGITPNQSLGVGDLCQLEIAVVVEFVTHSVQLGAGHQ